METCQDTSAATHQVRQWWPDSGANRGSREKRWDSCVWDVLTDGSRCKMWEKENKQDAKTLAPSNWKNEAAIYWCGKECERGKVGIRSSALDKWSLRCLSGTHMEVLNRSQYFWDWIIQYGSLGWKCKLGVNTQQHAADSQSHRTRKSSSREETEKTPKD